VKWGFRQLIYRADKQKKKSHLFYEPENLQMKKWVPVFSCLIILVSCNQNEKPISKPSTTDSITSNRIVPSTKQKFIKSEIINPDFDTALIFGIWGTSLTAPACEFEITANHLLLCDYDGDGQRFYKIIGDSILLDNPTLVFKGKILRVTKDSLILHWQNNDKPEVLLKWPKRKQ
jgi:hypothetical protein